MIVGTTLSSIVILAKSGDSFFGWIILAIIVLIVIWQVSQADKRQEEEARQRQEEAARKEKARKLLDQKIERDLAHANLGPFVEGAASHSSDAVQQAEKARTASDHLGSLLRSIDVSDAAGRAYERNEVKEILSQGGFWRSKCDEAVTAVRTAANKANGQLRECQWRLRTSFSRYGEFEKLEEDCRRYSEKATHALQRAEDAKRQAADFFQRIEHHAALASIIEAIRNEERIERGKARYPDFLTSRNALVYVSNETRCSRGHKLVEKKVTVLVFSRNGSAHKIEFEAGVCPDCLWPPLYFIPSATWRRLNDAGIPICRQVDSSNTSGLGGDWPLESLLHQFGYNVNQTDNHSDGYRRNILQLVISNRVYSQQEVAEYLRTRINLASGAQTRDMSTAIERWLSDLVWLRDRSFSPTSQPTAARESISSTGLYDSSKRKNTRSMVPFSSAVDKLISGTRVWSEEFGDGTVGAFVGSRKVEIKFTCDERLHVIDKTAPPANLYVCVS